jgi:cytochrome P450 family 6
MLTYTNVFLSRNSVIFLLNNITTSVLRVFFSCDFYFEDMSFVFVLSVIVAAVGIVVFWIKNQFSYWERHGFDYIKPEFPFGNLKGVGQKVHFSALSVDFYEKYKDKAQAIGLYFFTAPALFVTNLDLAKNILVRDFNIFHDRGLYTNKNADPISSHLFSIEGKE